MQNDKRLVVIASGSAQRATDYILNGIKTKEWPAGKAFVRLGLGVAAATTAYLVTPLFTDDPGPQVALTVAYGAAGSIGLLEARPGKPLPENVVANRVAMEAWEVRVARVREENQRRADGGVVTVDVGRVTGF